MTRPGPWDPDRRGERIRKAAALAFVSVIGVLPLLAVVVEAASSPSVLVATLRSRPALDALVNTLRLAVQTTLLSVLLGVPLAWLVARTDLPARRALGALLALPYVVPSYVAAVAWINLANPRVGLLNALLGEGALDIYSLEGITWVLALSFFPAVYLTVRAALENADPALEDAARMSGAGPLRVFRDVTLPLLRPAVLSSAGLVFMATASAFGAPQLIGSPARVDVLSTLAFESIASGLGGIAEASALACVLLCFALVPLLLTARRHAVVGGRASRPTRVPLGRARWPVWGLVLSFVLVGVVLPVLAVFVTAFLRVAGDLSPANFTWENVTAVARPETTRAILTSLGLGIAAASCAVLLGGFLAFLEVRGRGRGRRLLAFLAGAPLAVPGTVLALGLILVWTRVLSLTHTVWILLVAYVAKYLALATRAIGEGLGTIDDALPDAARLSGAGAWMRTRTIWLPLVLPSLAAAFFLVFMPCFSELTMSVLLVAPGMDTVGTRMFHLQEYEAPPAASVLAAIVIACVLGASLCVTLLGRRRRRFP